MNKIKNAINNLNECKAKKKELKSHPIKIYIEPTTDCNLNCIYCIPKQYRKVEEMDLKVFHSIKEQLFDSCCEVNLFLRGEPTLSKNLTEMMNICSEYSFITKIFSNMSYENDELMKKFVEKGVWLNVSFDGIEVNEKVRRGSNIALITRNIQLLMKYQKHIQNNKFHIRLAVVVSKLNVKNLINIILWAEKMGFKEIMFGCLDAAHFGNKNALTRSEAYYFQKAIEKCDEIEMRVSTPSHIGGKALKKTHNWNDFILPIDEFFPHFIEDCNPDVKKKFCPYPWLQTVFMANGDVVSCCQRKIKLGNIKPDMNFIESIWNNNNYINLRSKKKFHKCTDSTGVQCGIIKYSIWGGESRLNNIPIDTNIL